ncbi:lysophospholipid acyltransferase family protein [Curvivirga aplysinae]|uniref:lysophospholipid acyltransferase family protein n=1 Tax=Curvivirga aplysinae TaxID=2529852 RepID=UPI0012BD0185|nr:lysophospholipid acyltransferase family protein [Curvivirga aplysinae]MTI11435.1 1-acyl-sn-glycerol-3-phosphate acyltransferase [Curvivirga aplysinae]
MMDTSVKFSFFLALRRALGMLFGTLLILLRHLPAVIKRDVPIKHVQSWHKLMCKHGGLDVVWEGKPCDEKNVMYVSNHVSYIDIPVMGTELNAWFVAKSEVRGWPGFGFLAELGKTVFIERRSRRAADQKNQFAELLSQGRNLIVYPEGTSTDGTDVAPFKPTLFEAVFSETETPIKVQPFSITYCKFNGQRLPESMRDYYAWYGDMTLGDHFWHWLGLGRIEVRLRFHDPVTKHDFDDRKDMAKYCENIVRKDLQDY